MCATANDHLHERVNGLPAKIEHDSVVLILGTLPGKRSLMTGTYYADPSNKFWDILFMACGEKIEKSDTAKEILLKKYHIALWDILHSAVRDTSSDKDLLDEKPNDLPQFLAEYPQIKLLLFHSNDSYRYFKRFFKKYRCSLYLCILTKWAKQEKHTGKSRGMESGLVLCHSTTQNWAKIGVEGDTSM